MQLTKDASGGVLKIAGALHISTAEELRDALREWVSGEARPCADLYKIDLSEVDECDASALQLLCSACKTAERSNKRLAFAGVSAAICDAVAALGLSLTGDQAVEQGREDAI